MTDQERAVMKQALEALEYHVEQTRPIHRTSEAITVLRAALAEPVQGPLIGRAATDVPVPVYVLKKAEPVACNPHPKAPHGFLRNASHNEDRYVCECEGWEPYEAGYQAGLGAALRAQS